MQRLKLCSCGRPKADAEAHVQRAAGGLRITHYRCECGAEWSENVVDVDIHDPVTSEEIIAVHERMKLELPLAELLQDEA